MDNLIQTLYGDYGRYSNYRNFPSVLDGLKPVERRVLLAAYKIARHHFVKSRQVDAYTIGHYHPHGEVYGTIVQMVRQGFLDGQGSFGTSIGVEPVGAAAARYTECKMNPRTMEMAFRNIDHVPWVDTELNDKEPVFLPTLFPFCLMGEEYTQGIGFGFKTFIPCYDIQDLYKRLLWLLGEEKKKPIIAPITHCQITSPPKVLDELLITGRGKIDVLGVIKPDPQTASLTVYSWPPGKRFASLLENFSQELNDEILGFSDLSSDHTEIVFKILRKRNQRKHFENLVKKMREVNRGSISFETLLVDENHRVVNKGIDDLLRETYERSIQINERMLQAEIEKLQGIMDEYKMLIKIRPHIATGIQKKWESDRVIEYASKKTKIDCQTVFALVSKYKIYKLLTITIDTDSIKSDMEAIKENLDDIQGFTLFQYENFMSGLR